jgi:Arc/MetJ-type ribon-helix-helix transcriptional regulator
MNEMVHLRLEPKIRNEIKKIVKDNMFSNESEFIRDSIRRNLENYRKIQLLDSMRGTLKPSKNPTKLKRSEVFRALGLED